MVAQFQRIVSILSRTHQKTMLEQLETSTPFQKLVATVLSARTKDVTVLPIAKRLFKRYPTPQALMGADRQELRKILYGVGFYRIKSKNIRNLSKILMARYDGTVPKTLSELTSLPGVGRKTANCVLASAFHLPAIAVDTHVHRIGNRLGWVNTKTPEETEQELMNSIPKRSWHLVNNLLVDHGQRICLPRGPKCDECPILKFCPTGQLRVG